MESANNQGRNKSAVYVVAVLATFLLMAFLVMQMIRITQPAPVGAARAKERMDLNAQVRAAGIEAAKSWGRVQEPPTAAPNGFVRVPMEEAMKLTVQGYQNPADFRSNLVSRAFKANTPVSFE